MLPARYDDDDIETKIDYTQQNIKYRICGDKDETTNHIVVECIKLAQNEFKPIHDWVGKIIYRVLCKKSKFDHATNFVPAQTSLP